MVGFGLLTPEFWQAIQTSPPPRGLFDIPQTNPNGASWQSIADSLAGASQALNSGRRMSPLGAIGTAFGAGNQAYRQSQAEQRQGLLNDWRLKTSVEDYQTKRAQEAAKQKAIDDYIAAQPVEGQSQLRAAAAAGALDSVISDQYKPFTPNLQTRISGSTEQQGYFDRSGNWISLGSGPRWQGPQGPQLPADATIYDPAVLNGQGGQVYATGPLKGQIARPGRENGPTATQQAGNAEIDNARQYIDSMGLGFDEIRRRTSPQTATGLENPDYDPYLGSLYRKAMRRKVGGDEDFDAFTKKWRPGGSTDLTASGAPTGQTNLYGPGSSQDNPLGVQTPEQAARLPAGTWFKTIDGRTARRSAQ
jgi:hypothetical protein